MERLAAIFQQALDALKTNTAPDLQLRSLFRLRNQGIVLELTSAEAARWVKNPTHRTKFTEKLGGKICLKDRQYNVVVPFLPVSTDINAPDTIQHIEEGNELPRGSISQIRWIKDPAKRTSRQRVAHALFSLTTPEAANRIIDQGICVYCHDRVTPRDSARPLDCCRLKSDRNRTPPTLRIHLCSDS